MLVILVGFATAFHLLYMQPELAGSMDMEELDLTFGTPVRTALTVYDMLLGSYDVSLLRFSSSPALAWTLFVCFSFLMTIVLLNLLISILGDSFDRVQERADVEWRRERALLLVEMEQLIPKDPATRRTYMSLVGAQCAPAASRVRSAYSSSQPHCLPRRYPQILHITTSVEQNLLKRPFLMSEDDDENGTTMQWQGRVQALKRRIERMEGNIESQVESITKAIERLERRFDRSGHRGTAASRT